MHTFNKLKRTGLAVIAVFFIALGCTAQTGGCTKPPVKENVKLEILTYGLPDFARQNARNTVADRWGISFRAIAGCIIDDEISTTAKANNDKVYPLIEAKYGKDWIEKFDREVEEEYKRQQKVTDIISSLDYIQTKQAALNKQGGESGNYFMYAITPIANTSQYKVQAQAWDSNGEKKWMTYYTLLVDYKTKKVKVMSDKSVSAE